MRLNVLIANWRWVNKITVREAAWEIGVNASTICRVEAGEKMDGVTLAKIIVWMTKPVDRKAS